MAELKLSGLHHVTAICSDPQHNLDFYTEVLGLRLVKLTVNFDDPTAYHLYYGDAVGTPGTILTFFNYGHGHRGCAGAGSFCSFTFAVPPGSLDFWKERLETYEATKTQSCFGEWVVNAKDPDGLNLRFVEDADVSLTAWPTVGRQNAISRIAGVKLGSRNTLSNKFAETSLLGVEEASATLTSGNVSKRYRVGKSTLDILPITNRSVSGPGTIHHVAWAVANDAEQAHWLAALQKQAVPVSDVKDRDYFHSIYFREPGGALYEIATDNPGFATDESVENLGSSLRLPAMWKPERARIEAALPPLRLPAVTV